ncbi:redox-regulated ATPase YchF [Candidatus Peregrinibacteria bacterium CG10_big_fil_rev_8_21_14_0_10_49_24]|nr:MAG: redox-regulated ATPase YchF [Candidatus Peregrinibacteria bacterium CG11_big_fil_rev_8_21_14_0_20_49_14]PIR50645.1 MAG: redox-regulated ATPase YchF [Candidatus Peregrinibacteria bacterium CG10_big_fil_rev_8_21_14_0_10_49_24]PJA67729.1 MAG: redox-regulated ATPase YchF [Candidatus Peregrinibacteria bacterium CG_4_9_14_3_um_filter_49_12]
MALQIGIVGLPNVGKSTLFNALTRSKGAEAANYPFCTIEPNVGIVEVPDRRLSTLTSMVNPQKIIPAAIEFKDIAGLVKGASKGEGLGNKFLHAIREVDAICHVVRAFGDSNITHVEGTVDPKRDRETIEAELIISDIDSVEKQMDKVAGGARTGEKSKLKELALLQRVQATLNEGKTTHSLECNEEESRILKNFHLLTNKPIIYAVNIAEDDLRNADTDSLRKSMGIAQDEQLITISAKIEEDLQELSAEEAQEMLSELGIESAGLDKLIQAAYMALGYITYFTAGEKEVRAWNVRKGSTAPQAAGVIHTDFEKGFIRADTIAYEDYVQFNGEQGAKEAGKMRSEGKEYIVKDGDIMHFKFNV